MQLSAEGAISMLFVPKRAQNKSLGIAPYQRKSDSYVIPIRNS